MPNTMDIEDFDVLRDKALLAVLTAYPTGSLPALGQTLSSDTNSIGSKVMVLSIISRGALALASLEEETQDPLPLGVDTSLLVVNSAISGVGKTVIKRPVKLRLMKERTRYFNNPIGTLMSSFLQPVEQLLGTTYFK